jgi:hypothetical protein
MYKLVYQLVGLGLNMADEASLPIRFVVLCAQIQLVYLRLTNQVMFSITLRLVIV